MLRVVATFDANAWAVQVIPLAASIGAAPKVTEAVIPEEHTPAVTEPFAQYVKLPDVAVPAT